MPSLPVFYALFLGLSGALALFAVWSRRGLALRAGAVALFALTVAVAYGAFNDLLSRPKPSAFELVHGRIDQAEVLGASLSEGRAIYLWLRLPGVEEPRYYVMPWQHEAAEGLQEAIREAERNRSGLLMRLPFEKSLEDRSVPRFHAVPRSKLPDKPKGDIQDYRHPSLPI